MNRPETVFEEEQQRVLAEYLRREREIPADVYAPWQPTELFMRLSRKRLATTLLKEAGVFPVAGTRCLEVGFGALGWLGELISWGVRESDLHGIELDPVRAEKAKAILPVADLRVGDATQIPWEDEAFDLVIVSTVFTSILNSAVRRQVAEQITRVLKPGGALLWYDFAFDNPRNSAVKKVDRKELGELFPALDGKLRKVTLAPPVARLVAPRSWLLTMLLEAIPLLRTHLMGVLIKQH
jgi:ubiquinone/menaquinone biosynthesis C-methylase UbiE